MRAQQLRDVQDEIRRSDAFAQLAAHVHTHHFWRQKVNRLAEHPRFRFNSAHTPADHTKAVDHGRMRVRPDQRVREKYFRSPVSAFRF